MGNQFRRRDFQIQIYLTILVNLKYFEEKKEKDKTIRTCRKLEDELEVANTKLKDQIPNLQKKQLETIQIKLDRETQQRKKSEELVR